MNTCKNIHKRTLHTQKCTQTHVKMLINYVKFHTNACKCIYTHTKIHIKSTQTHVKTQTNTCTLKMTQTYINNYIGSRYIGMLFIPKEYYTVWRVEVFVMVIYIFLEMIILIVICFAVVFVLGLIMGMLFEFGKDINLGYINFW